MANMSEPPVSLEDLLKLKRHERPEGEFWDKFERDFQRRRLRALMESKPGLRALSGQFWRSVLLWSPVGVGALAAAAFTFLPVYPPNSEQAAVDRLMPEADATLSNSSALAVADSISAGIRVSPATRSSEFHGVQQAQLASRFVTDELATQDESRNFRRILSSASLNVPAAVGSRYVADPLTANRMEATSAVLRPRAHF